MTLAGTKKGPDINGNTKFPLELRAQQLGQPPLCKCGCGRKVKWDFGRARWRPYATRPCFHPQRPYQDEAWLRDQYVNRRRSTGDIGRECGVADTTVTRYLKRFGIEPRSPSERQIGVNAGDKNPAWKGGIARWPYASDWKRIARSVRNRAEWTCQRCGERRKRWGKALHVHHIDRNKFNNDPTNLVALCAPCHRKIEYE